MADLHDFLVGTDKVSNISLHKISACLGEYALGNLTVKNIQDEFGMDATANTELASIISKKIDTAANKSLAAYETGNVFLMAHENCKYGIKVNFKTRFEL